VDLLSKHAEQLQNLGPQPLVKVVDHKKVDVIFDLLSAGTNPERSLISAQNLPFLRRFVTEQGKILSRRLTRVTARQQREITKAIKQARILGYLQFVNTK
jgi:small subunit ribosomal protein S18